MNPQVSVVIPVYNSAAFIDDTLKSVLASNYNNFEIVAVDDGSTDASLAILNRVAACEERMRVIHQENQGVSVARNVAIEAAQGKYILPVDSDNLIHPDYIAQAVATLESRPDVKVVTCEVQRFGLENRRVRYARFSRRLIARKNMIDVCSMFRRDDFFRFTSGFCPEIKGREDWDFWISLLKSGGDVVRLPLVGLQYRVHSGSKRKRTQNRKRILIEQLNERHTAFFCRMLGGKLHFRRTFSRLFNFATRPKEYTKFRTNSTGVYDHLQEEIFDLCTEELTGLTIKKQRNNIVLIGVGESKFVVKIFGITFWQSLVYGILRKSKAERSFMMAEKLLLHGINTPAPVAFFDRREKCRLRRSVYVSEYQPEIHTFESLIIDANRANRDAELVAAAKFTADMHAKGFIHRDYSPGNILIDKTGSQLSIVDLNRVHCQRVSIKSGCCNFERLNIDRRALTLMGQAYAAARHADQDFCVQQIIEHRWRKHVKQNITNLE